MAKPYKRRIGLKIFLAIQIILILLVIAGVTFYYVGGYGKIISRMQSQAIEMVSNSREDSFRQVETSIAYDSKGKVLSILKGEKDVYYLDYKDIPVNVKEAIVSIEDKKFYDHGGVDFRAVLRAIWAMIRNGRVTQGASTITQQLARTIFLTQDKTWERKIQEMFIAWELEKRYSKSMILEFYLNNIYFANGYYGIEAASRGYFNKSCKNLTLSQAAFLCAIPNRPSYYDPVINMDKTLERRNLVLRNMYGDGIISIDQYRKAVKEKIVLRMPKKVKHNYQETYIIYCATRALMADEGFEFRNEFINEQDEEAYNESYRDFYEECNRKLYRGGYRIYTSLDSEVQKQLQQCIDNELEYDEEVAENGIYAFQGAATCIDNETGLVKAIVGGRSQEYDGYTLNRAYQSPRQPGSSIKPLIVYTPVLERGYTQDSVVVDEKIEGGPENSGGRYAGRITLRNAVVWSKNTIAWKLLQEITPAAGISYLRNMGFTHLEKTDEVPAAALGGFTRGATTTEMAGGFATIENKGYYREATCIDKITDSQDNLLYSPDRTPVKVYKENAAVEMTDILTGVFTDSGGTARGLQVVGMPCAGKTGTTNDNKDGWFVGFTPYYTTAVWIGYDTPRTLGNLWGATIPGRVWNKFMTNIHEKLEYKDFDNTINEGEENPQQPLQEVLQQQDTVVEEEDDTFEGVVPLDEIPENGEIGNGEETIDGIITIEENGNETLPEEYRENPVEEINDGLFIFDRSNL